LHIHEGGNPSFYSAVTHDGPKTATASPSISTYTRRLGLCKGRRRGRRGGGRRGKEEEEDKEEKEEDVASGRRGRKR
jgi:hypothetical protein